MEAPKELYDPPAGRLCIDRARRLYQRIMISYLRTRTGHIVSVTLLLN